MALSVRAANGAARPIRLRKAPLMLDAALQPALIARLTALADDELILGHRDAEWTGHAPILEEDIALANIAQDELGHASLYYALAESLTGVDGDQMAFFREPAAFRNVQLVELPKGDWAFTMLRQYLFDAYELALLELLRRSAYAPLAEVAAKIMKEELYHLRHTQVWVARLGLGTQESARRLQTALDTLWPYTAQLFAPLPDEAGLIAAGYLPDLARVRARWEGVVSQQLAAANLRLPTTPPLTAGRHAHTPHLAALLAEMQAVARADPEATW